MTRWVLVLGLACLQAASASGQPRIRNTTVTVEGVGVVSYGIAVPTDYREGEARPLVVALHAGGQRIAYQGSRFMQELVLPGLGELNAIVVAPDCPDRSWVEPLADQAVVSLIAHVRKTHTIDPRKVLVTGFSMGGRGAWTLSTRHADLFTAAIVMAAPVSGGVADGSGKVPTYVIHSRDDLTAPFAQAAQAASRLEASGYPLQFVPIDGAGHNIPRFVESLRLGGRWLAGRWADSGDRQ